VYNSGCDNLCLCYFHGHCHNCENGHCEHPIHIKYLVKKPRYCVEECTKCVPTEVPCETGHCLVAHGHGTLLGHRGHGHGEQCPVLPAAPTVTAPAAPAGEPIPAPKVPPRNPDDPGPVPPPGVK
jgi:hypothetical protein